MLPFPLSRAFGRPSDQGHEIESQDTTGLTATVRDAERQQRKPHLTERTLAMFGKVRPTRSPAKRLRLLALIVGLVVLVVRYCLPGLADLFFQEETAIEFTHYAGLGTSLLAVVFAGLLIAWGVQLARESRRARISTPLVPSPSTSRPRLRMPRLRLPRVRMPRLEHVRLAFIILTVVLLLVACGATAFVDIFFDRQSATAVHDTLKPVVATGSVVWVLLGVMWIIQGVRRSFKPAAVPVPAPAPAAMPTPGALSFPNGADEPIAALMPKLTVAELSVVLLDALVYAFDHGVVGLRLPAGSEATSVIFDEFPTYCLDVDPKDGRFVVTFFYKTDNYKVAVIGHILTVAPRVTAGAAPTTVLVVPAVTPEGTRPRPGRKKP